MSYLNKPGPDGFEQQQTAISKSNPSLGTVVFILSSDRSGSTWLGYVLGSTSQASFLGEFRRAWDDALRVPCSWCSSHGLTDCEVLGGIEKVPEGQAFEAAFSRCRKRVLVDTSKRTAWAEKFIAPDSPFEVRLIHLLRDPRGWYASERRRRPETRISDWVDENLHIRNFLASSNVPSTTVFYEDLASSQAKAFEELCADLGLAFEPDALRYWEKVHHGYAANGASSPLLSSAPKISNSTSFITGDDSFYTSHNRKQFVDQRWRNQLSDEDALAITENSEVAEFLALYDRVLTDDGLRRLTSK